jgi:hypothetical protein
VGLIQFPRALVLGQPDGFRRWHPCCHRCLLKGCERWFLPPRPQARYCGPACQRAAGRWRNWYAGQRYRTTIQGKERRREQARRRRERARRRSSLAESAPQTSPIDPASPVTKSQTPAVIEAQTPAVIEAQTSPVIEAQTSPVIEAQASPVIEAHTTSQSDSTPTIPADSQRVGQRPAEIPQNSCGLPCSRPGCYVLFLPSARSPDQHFCSGSCRLALRRVRQREARLRRRRRRGIPARYRRHRGPPPSQFGHVVTY